MFPIGRYDPRATSTLKQQQRHKQHHTGKRGPDDHADNNKNSKNNNTNTNHAVAGGLADRGTKAPKRSKFSPNRNQQQPQQQPKQEHGQPAMTAAQPPLPAPAHPSPSTGTTPNNNTVRTTTNKATDHKSSASDSTLFVIAEDAARTTATATTRSRRRRANTTGLHALPTKLLQQEALDDLDLVVPGVEVDIDDDPVGDGEAEEDVEASSENHQKATTTTTVKISRPTSSTGGLSWEEIRMAKRVAELDLRTVASQWGLAPWLIENLARDGFQHFSPIQALTIPNVMASERHPHLHAQDVCLTAPTGSGKTLAYLIPILQALSHRQVCRLYALIVLPSRDLAIQVYQVVQRYMEGSYLKVGLAIGGGGGGAGNSSNSASSSAAVGDGGAPCKTGQGPAARNEWKTEQLALTVGLDGTAHDDDDDDQLHFWQSNQPTKDLRSTLRAYRSCGRYGGDRVNDDAAGFHVPASGWSNVDVLVCTPGRLVDHLDRTPGFTVQHVKFLVVDEADRLLNQPYHNWIDRVLQQTSMAESNYEKNYNAARARLMEGVTGNMRNPSWLQPNMQTWRPPSKFTQQKGGHGATSNMDHSTLDAVGGEDSFRSLAATVCRPVQLRKFLVSATLTRDPQKLATLGLLNPKHYDVHQLLQQPSSRLDEDKGDGETTTPVVGHKYSMPEGLQEYTATCTAEQKPLVLVSLILEHLGIYPKSTLAIHNDPDLRKIVVVFTSSVDSTHRLARLLQLMWSVGKYSRGGDGGAAVVEYSSSLNQTERARLIQQCHDPTGPVRVVVCSDGMSRGMDLGLVSAVINYDVPSLAKTYVHRCGRTARAGRAGTAWTLLKSGQVSQFNRMRGLIFSGQRQKQPQQRQQQQQQQKQQLVPAYPIPRKYLQLPETMTIYRQCVAALKEVLDAERHDELRPTDPLTEDNIPSSSGDGGTSRSPHPYSIDNDGEVDEDDVHH